jgi:P27 family predicted phage terminase small subunit
MPRGGARNTKPAADKLARGNPGKRPVNLFEPKPGELRSPNPPTWMSRLAKDCWKATLPELVNMGLMSEADINTLALYCQAYSRYRQATAVLEADDVDSDTHKTWSVRLEKAESSLRLLSHDLGLNPAARARLSVNRSDKPVDEMEGLLGRNRA